MLIHRQRIWTIWKSQWKHSYFTFSFTGNGLAPTTNKCCDFNAILSCSVMDEKCNLQCPKLKIHHRMYRNVSFSNVSPNGSHNFQCSRHYTVNLWQFCVYSLIRYWHYAKFVTGHRKKNEHYNKIAERCDSMCSILSFGISMKICFICINHVFCKI